jgi:hypothetical protein
MDPFIESQEWEDFHTRAITVIADMLAPRLGGRYAARIERRIYVEHMDDPEPDLVIADVAIVPRSSDQAVTGTELISLATPVTCVVAVPEERRESYLVVKDLERDRVVAIIELLSPSNKRRGSGRKEYVAKREEVLSSSTHLVELDLLRGGTRVPMRSALPRGDYYAVVSSAWTRPRSDVYAWHLPDRMPGIRIPLAARDEIVPLDLQAVLDTVYDRAQYGGTLRYSAPLVPPADAETQKWIDRVLGDHKSSSSRQ